MTPVSSNEPRDQLVADLMAHRWFDGPHSAHSEHRFDGWCAICGSNVVAIVDLVAALGWRPPPRVIETASVLRDELHGTVIRFRDGTVAAVDTAGGHWPGRVMTLENPVYYWHLTDGDTELFPARVLWESEEPAGEPHRIDVTHVAPGELERMARSGARPSPELRAAIDRARDRKGADRG